MSMQSLVRHMEIGQFHRENKLRMLKKTAKLSVYFYFPEHKFLRLQAQGAVQMPNLKCYLYTKRVSCIMLEPSAFSKIDCSLWFIRSMIEDVASWKNNLIFFLLLLMKLKERTQVLVLWKSGSSHSLERKTGSSVGPDATGSRSLCISSMGGMKVSVLG